MSSFSPQHYKQIGRRLGVDPAVLETAAKIGTRITASAPDRAVVFSLRHLSALSGVPYQFLRDWVGRWGPDPYREFFLAKKPDGRTANKPSRRPKRRIAAPTPILMRQQRWLVERVLHHAPRHPSSMAFHRKADIVETARLHCQCNWLIKMDIRNFFESIYEPSVFNVFVELGYPRLLAFELTRLCTRIVPENRLKWASGLKHGLFDARRGPKFYSRVRKQPDAKGQHAIGKRDRFHEWVTGAIGSDRLPLPLGSLPQGAPTSPLLANLAVRGLDERINIIAAEHDMTYTRYADDVALSTERKDFSRKEAGQVIGKIKREFEREGLLPHHSKTRLVSPGARKIVLGLVVDGKAPRLTREYRNKLRLHAHMLGTRGISPSAHASALRFRSVISMRRHIEGKIAHARRVEEPFADKIAAQLAKVDWTL
ncbi:RNA-directed DNA polymerase [Erythrobacter sp. A30-3]|nr:RNA-directed DNA polymerase [Erythrobacter sp. A30-3]